MTSHNRRTFLQTAGVALAASLAPGLATAQTPRRSEDDLAWLTLSEASDLVRRRRISSAELTSACLARIARLNPDLNAFITVTAERATAEAQAADADIAKGTWRGPLHGIPVALKDLFDT